MQAQRQQQRPTLTEDQKAILAVINYYLATDWKGLTATLSYYGYPYPDNHKEIREYSYELLSSKETGKEAMERLTSRKSLLRDLFLKNSQTNKSFNGEQYLNYGGEDQHSMSGAIPQIPAFHGQKDIYVPNMSNWGGGVYNSSNMLNRSAPLSDYERYLGEVNSGFNYSGATYTDAKKENIKALKTIGGLILLIIAVEAMFKTSK